MAALKPVFKQGGSVTAGNSSGRNGGAIALGHPIGDSGARILVTLLYAMRKKNVRYGVAALCVAGGLGVAVVIEKI